MKLSKRIIKPFAVVFTLGIFFGAFLVDTSNAVAPVPVGASCSSTPIVYLITKPPTIEKLQDFLKRADIAHPNANQKKLCASVWAKANAEFQSTGYITSITSWNDRFNSCVNDSINPVIGIKCMVIVGTIPKMEVIKSTFNDTYDFLNNHVPSGYATEVLHFLAVLKSDWLGGFSCNDNVGISGGLKWSYQVGNSTHDLNIVIPCKPPTALKPLRKIMAIGVFMLFLSWCYNRYEEVMAQIALNSAPVYGPENKEQHDYGFWGH